MGHSSVAEHKSDIPEAYKGKKINSGYRFSMDLNLYNQPPGDRF